MKKIFFLLFAISLIGLWVCPTDNVNAQGVGINPSGNNPHPSALLDLSSTSKGALMPRMTTTERDAISNPAQSLLIFNVTTKCFEFWDNGGWQTLGCTPCPPVAAPSTGTNTPSATQMVWSWNTVSGATGYKWGTTNDYNSATDLLTATSKTETGLTCNTVYTRFVWAYSGCTNSTATTLTQSTSVCPFACGSILSINHSIGTVSPETKTVNYGTVSTTLGGTGAKCWITQNLGATNQASSNSDNSDAAAGWYWQYNRMQGYKVGPTPSWTITSINENSDWLAANDPCTIELGAGWRIPTTAEWTNADATGTWNNYTDTYNSVLKLHAAGYLINSNGALDSRGILGYAWSSNQVDATTGGTLVFYSNHSAMDTNNSKTYGFPLRCLKD